VRAAERQVEVTARQAVVTLPLPTLCELVGASEAAGIAPTPAGWPRALTALHMGTAHRAVLGFDRRWWAADGENGPSFVHGGGEPFPVWWTALPSHEPLITGWTGGPHAVALNGQPEGAMLRAALDSLASVFRRDPAELRSRLRLAYTYDWSADPLSRGAYTYGGVGAIEARETLARPVAGTLVLAGEAIARRGRNATVHGALASGWEAASALLAG
jgi:monoamine oxidase